MTGLYIHIPFCATKCAYCDFYSLKYNKDTVSKYVEEVCRRIKNIDVIFDTVYFGGGTPSIIGADNLIRILSCVNYVKNAEITVEVNPRTYAPLFFEKLFKSGFNRISIGLQSAIDNELKSLTRNHLALDVENAVLKAKNAGFINISLDVMIGTQHQTINSLKQTLDFCIDLDVNHLSCYMLKIEENTPFSKMNLDLPDETQVSDMYLFLCDYLDKNGFKQYEISNFAKGDKFSRHNTLYWECENYYGIGPSAHSFINGKRYYFPNDINYFFDKKDMIFDCEGGDLYDIIMLGLRLKKGINLEHLKEKGYNLSDIFYKKLKFYAENGFAKYNDDVFSLTPRGFLVQNTILTDILEDI